MEERKRGQKKKDYHSHWQCYDLSRSHPVLSSPQTKTCPGNRYFLAHGWVGVLTCKGARQSTTSLKKVSLMSHLGAGCESSTWDHSTQYRFATS